MIAANLQQRVGSVALLDLERRSELVGIERLQNLVSYPDVVARRCVLVCEKQF